MPKVLEARLKLQGDMLGEAEATETQAEVTRLLLEGLLREAGEVGGVGGDGRPEAGGGPGGS